MKGLAFLGASLAALTVACSAERPAAWSDTSPHTVRMVTIAPGVTLETLDWGGNGPPLVILTGLQDVAHGFDDFAPLLTDSFHVVGITRRGYGASSQPPGGYDIASRVEDLRLALDSLHLDKVTLVGHSIAGDELTAFAGAYPGRVESLIYFDAAFDHSNLGPIHALVPPVPPMQPADSASPAAVQAYFKRTYGMTIPEAQLRAVGRYDEHGRLVANVTPSAIDSMMLADCGQPDYQLVQAPSLVIDAVIDSAPQFFPIWDSLTPEVQQQARRFTEALQAWAATHRAHRQATLRNAEFLPLHGANHYVFDSNREEVLAAMRRFLAK